MTKFILLQWNARSLTANGNEFKKFIASMKQLPDIICIQETWLKSQLQFSLAGYKIIRRDRKMGNGGGLATFIREGITFKINFISREFEILGVDIWGANGKIKIINYYNPCKKLSIKNLEERVGPGQDKEIWCGDFNAHSTLWGSSTTDGNGLVVEEFIQEKGLVCLNNGKETRFSIGQNKKSVIDLTLVSPELAAKSSWKVLQSTTLGSDHYPILCEIGKKANREKINDVRRWNFNKADWEKFSEISERRIQEWYIPKDIEESNKEICGILYRSAEESIPKKKIPSKKPVVPWWTKECAIVIKNRNKALRVVRKTMLMEDLIKYKQTQAITRKTIKTAKRNYWRNFCSGIGTCISVNEVWGMIKKMRGIRKTKEIPVMQQGKQEAISDIEKAEMLAQTFVKSHSTTNLSNNLIKNRKILLDKNPEILQKRTVLDNILDCDLTIKEIKQAIIKSGNTSPGKDDICYIMLKHLTDKSLIKLLEYYNNIWKAGKIPSEWKRAIVIPIEKPGKDSINPDGYRPISLTSHLSKIMERIIMERLSYYLERQNSFSPYQCGFRKGRMTMDSVICLKDDIVKAQIYKEVVIAVLFDIEKAYDMLWREGLLIKLNLLGIGGRIYNWIMDFLMGRTIQVRVGSSTSKVYSIENGTPQGSVCSPILFNIMINDIFQLIEPRVAKSLYADDGAIWKRGRNLEYVARKIQEAITVVEEWANTWGFKLSVSKTKVIGFSKRNKIRELRLKLYGQELEQVKIVKFLGMWMDSKLTWKKHIDQIVEKGKKGINVLKCLAGCDWGASRASLLNIYDALIRSIFDYGCMVYRSAAKTNLKKLDIIQVQALRICCGAVKSSPVVSIQVETGETPLHLRRMALTAVYWANLKGYPENHPATTIIMQEQIEQLNDTTRNVGSIFNKEAEEIGIKNWEYSRTVPRSNIPPWMFPMPIVDLTLQDKHYNKEEIYPANILVEKHLAKKYNKYIQAYTDGSKNPKEGTTAAAIHIPKFGITIKKRLTNNLSVYTTEVIAIIIVLQWAEEVGPEKMVVCSDSLSVLQSIQTGQSSCRPDLILEVQQLLFRLQKLLIQVEFLWVPAHKGIKGNEIADKAARECLTRTERDIKVPISKSETKTVIKEYVRKIWQENWTKEHKGRHLYKIQPTINTRRRQGYERREDIVLSRLRIGHSLLNASLVLIKKHNTGLCRHCQQKETSEHVLLYCQKYNSQRTSLINALNQKGYKEFTMKELLSYGLDRNYIHKQIFEFLRKIKIYNSI